MKLHVIRTNATMGADLAGRLDSFVPFYVVTYYTKEYRNGHICWGGREGEKGKQKDPSTDLYPRKQQIARLS